MRGIEQINPKNQYKIIVAYIIAITLTTHFFFQFEEEKVQILNEAGQYFTIDYRMPHMIQITPQLPDKQPGIIGDPQNYPNVIEFLKDKNKDNFFKIFQDVNQDNQKLIYEAEYQYYNRQYNLDKYRRQLNLCILSGYRNFFSGPYHLSLLDTLENQNYSNFQWILIDDLSTDHSVERLIELLPKQYPRLSHRTRIIKNKDYMELMGNLDIATRNFCKEDSVIVQVDADDLIGGRQAFKVVNAHYQDYPETWLLYTDFGLDFNYVYKDGWIPDQVFSSNTYRISGLWITSHLKTYLRKLYMKIPLQCLFREPGKYFLLAADRFVMYPLIQMAGANHTKYVEEAIYIYKVSNSYCSWKINVLIEKISRMMTPLKPLSSLSDTPQKVDNYKYPPFLDEQKSAVLHEIRIYCLIDFALKNLAPTYVYTAYT